MGARLRFRQRSAHLVAMGLGALFACSSDGRPSDIDLDPAALGDAAISEGNGGDNAATAGNPGAGGSDGQDGNGKDAGDSNGVDDDDEGDDTGFAPIGDPTKNGPFPTNNPRGEPGGPSCSIHRPATLGENGLRHPVIIWGMGTGGFNTYQATFDLWASHGFVVAAALQGDGQGSGESMLACLEHVCSAYAPNIDCSRVGASGHSQGGGGAIMTGRDPRVIATAPVQPYIGQGFGGFDQAAIKKQSGPMLLLSGTNDTIAAPREHQEPVYDTTNVTVFWANLVGGDHVAEGINGIAGYRVIILEWFGLQLMGDKALRDRFYGTSCKYCSDGKWMVMRKGIQ